MRNLNSNAIRNWAENDRPREKLEKFGPKALTDAELLAILIQSGTPQESALDLARKVLSKVENKLYYLGRKNIRELTEIKGIGPVKAITIAAAMELAGRYSAHHEDDRPIINNSKVAYKVFYPELHNLSHEEFWVGVLNYKLQLLKKCCIGKGGINSAIVDTRLIFYEVLLHKGTGLVLCHNHPSGNPQPSVEDKRLTERIKAGCKIFDIQFSDHIIIGGQSYYSFSDGC